MVTELDEDASGQLGPAPLEPLLKGLHDVDAAVRCAHEETAPDGVVWNDGRHRRSLECLEQRPN
jgi:hypothetical protein